MFVENRFSIPLEEIHRFLECRAGPEDQRFYEHDGVWVGVVVRPISTFKTTRLQGNDHVQLARKSFDLLGESKGGWTGYERKIVEAFVALRIEKHFRSLRKSNWF